MTDPQQDRVDDYLLGRLGADAAREFDEEVSRNPDLSKALGDTETARAALELAEDRALKARLQALEQRLSAQPSPEQQPDAAERPQPKVVQLPARRPGVRRWLTYAAALLLLLAAGWWVTQAGSPDYRQLAMEHFEPFDNLTGGTVRGEDGPSAAAATAYAAYDAGDYAEAARLIGALPASDVNAFYLGQSQLALGDFAAAGGLFRTLSQRADFALAPEAAYYAALSELALTDEDNGTEGPVFTLRAIAADLDHPMRAEAQALLRRL